MHTRVATVHETDRASCVAAIQRAQADLIEVRLDALWPGPPEEEAAVEDLLAITQTGARLLATLRPKRQGGHFEGPEDLRVHLLIAAARAGFSAMDLEADVGGLAPLVGALRGEAELVLSDHGLPVAPSREEGLQRLQSMQDLQVATQKLAFPVGSFLDELRALELAHQHAALPGQPAIAPLGGDAAFRALLALAGNHATYGHAGRPAFSGQPGLHDIQAVWDHWGLGNDELAGRVGWFAVLGDPVAHSLSPRIHNAMLRHDGDARRYGALRVPDSIGAVRLVCSTAQRTGLAGASVTMPLKAHAAKACQGDAAVAATGAANCLRFQDGQVAGTNTDATALQRLLTGAQRVAVIGAGGAGRAAIWAAQELGAEVTLIARPGPRADEAAQQFQVPLVWDGRDEVAADAWVQATPIGMQGEPSPVANLHGATRAIELVYGHGPTDFQARAAQQGAAVTSGRDFLIEQALDAYRFWTGRQADRAIMEAA